MKDHIRGGRPKPAASETGIRKGPPPKKPAAHLTLAGRWRQRLSWNNIRFWLCTVAFVGVAVVGFVFLPEWLFPSNPRLPVDEGLAQAEDRSPPKLNPANPPGPAPEGMVWIPGGEFYMGNEELIDPEIPDSFWYRDAAPVHKVYVDGFWMDKTEVTNEQFAKFVEATGYVTYAEKPPNPKDFPDVPPDKLMKEPFSIVFKQPGPQDPVDFSHHAGWFDIAKGAYWRQPEGPGSHLKGREKHPVVHIAYVDAIAYCKWAGKRLPTEAEWAFAARGGLDRKKYFWGDELTPGGKWMCNVWQGHAAAGARGNRFETFPYKNATLDGFERTAPVGSFPPNAYGLYDMAGNVWEWCSDYFQPDYYEKSPRRNPKGPSSGFDPADPGTQKYVQRGGSFLCCDNYCRRYEAGSRGKGEPTSSASHIGFRCVKDAR